MVVPAEGVDETEAGEFSDATSSILVLIAGGVDPPVGSIRAVVVSSVAMTGRFFEIRLRSYFSRPRKNKNSTTRADFLWNRQISYFARFDWLSVEADQDEIKCHTNDRRQEAYGSSYAGLSALFVVSAYKTEQASKYGAYLSPLSAKVLKTSQ